MDSMTETSQQRFGSKELFVTPEAELKHFHPVDGVRDRFGNRIFTSRDLAYHDREGDTVKAALLVSKEGERFINDHPGILNKIDKSLRKWKKNIDMGGIGNQLQIDSNTKLTILGQGAQSRAHLIEIGEEFIVVKTRSTLADSKTQSNVTQPYINEMLQSQSMALDLKTDLAEIGITFPRFLFSSGQVSCIRFEQGRQPNEQRINKIKNILSMLFSNYINQRRSNPLWKNVYIDIVNWMSNKPRVDDIIEKEDGSLVFIDPFIYQPKRPTSFEKIQARIWYWIDVLGHD